MWESILLTVAATAGNNIGKILQKKGTIILPPLSFKLKACLKFHFLCVLNWFVLVSIKDLIFFWRNCYLNHVGVFEFLKLFLVSIAVFIWCQCKIEYFPSMCMIEWEWIDTKITFLLSFFFHLRLCELEVNVWLLIPLCLQVIRSYASNRTWVIGFLVDIFGALLMLRALSLAPVSPISHANVMIGFVTLWSCVFA